jgi:TRAP-type C4-dicarboxylate transport system permease small subunit
MAPLAARIETLIGRALNGVALLAGALLFLIAVVVTMDVLKRWITGRPILGVFEGVEVLLVAVTMGVLGLVEWQQRQLNVDVFTHRARGRTAVALVALDKALAALLVGVLLAMAAAEWAKAWNGWYLRRGMVEIPIVVPMGILVAGSGLTFIAAAWGCGKAVACLAVGRPYQVPMTGVEIGAPAAPDRH